MKMLIQHKYKSEEEFIKNQETTHMFEILELFIQSKIDEAIVEDRKKLRDRIEKLKKKEENIITHTTGIYNKVLALLEENNEQKKLENTPEQDEEYHNDAIDQAIALLKK